MQLSKLKEYECRRTNSGGSYNRPLASNSRRRSGPEGKLIDEGMEGALVEQISKALTSYPEATFAKESPKRSESITNSLTSKHVSAREIIERLNRIGCKMSMRKNGGREVIRSGNVELLNEQPTPPRCYCFSFEGSHLCYCYKRPWFTP